MSLSFRRCCEPGSCTVILPSCKPAFILHPEFWIGGQTARPVHGGQHPVSRSALIARSRNEFNASSHPVGPALSAGPGRGFGVCFGSVLSLSSLEHMDSPPSGPCLLDSPESAKDPVSPWDSRPEGLDSRFGSRNRARRRNFCVSGPIHGYRGIAAANRGRSSGPGSRNSRRFRVGPPCEPFVDLRPPPGPHHDKHDTRNRLPSRFFATANITIEIPR